MYKERQVEYAVTEHYIPTRVSYFSSDLLHPQQVSITNTLGNKAKAIGTISYC